MHSDINIVNSRRLDWLDTLRGVAIILVIMGHAIGGVDDTNIMWKIIYSFHMALMFMISGYCTKKYIFSTEDNRIVQIKRDILKNIVALYIPYLIFGYLFWGVKYFIYAGNEPVTLNDGVNLFWNCAGWRPGWYLLALLFIKVIDMLFECIGLQKEIQLLIWFVFVIIASSIPVYLLSKVCMFGIYFFLGKTICEKSEIILRRKKEVIVIAGIGISMSLIFYCFKSENSGKFFAGCFVSLLLFIIFQHVSVRSIIIKALGRDSMVPYVLHAYFTIPVRMILGYFGLQNIVSVTIMGTISAMLCSYIVIWLINNVKTFKCMQYLFYPSRLLKRRKEKV